MKTMNKKDEKWISNIVIAMMFFTVICALASAMITHAIIEQSYGGTWECIDTKTIRIEKCMIDEENGLCAVDYEKICTKKQLVRVVKNG